MVANLLKQKTRWMPLLALVALLALAAAGFMWWGPADEAAATPATAAEILESFEAGDVDPASIPFGTCGEDCKHTGK